MPPTSSNGSNPFTNPQAVAALYADRVRVQRRSNALLTVEIRGAHVGNMVADLLTRCSPYLNDQPAPLIADLGCDTGHPTRAIAQRFPPMSIPCPRLRPPVTPSPRSSACTTRRPPHMS
ncbi:hypothetical protein GCM10022416_56380 [Actinomadura keratinilytica]|jgi:hypothetical protein|uniref:Class I SAM-dependent methyltransferase n=1 Tax=Actinomadura keratinilytica TaxID=547461 RepID=A0ABP7ZEZ3_9ACTN